MKVVAELTLLFKIAVQFEKYMLEASSCPQPISMKIHYTNSFMIPRQDSQGYWPDLLLFLIRATLGLGSRFSEVYTTRCGFEEKGNNIHPRIYSRIWTMLCQDYCR